MTIIDKTNVDVLLHHSERAARTRLCLLFCLVGTWKGNEQEFAITYLT